MMSTRKAKLYRYSLPMDSGVILRDERLLHREGLIVELELDGKTALGEIAPLVGFSHESLDDAISQAQLALSAWSKAKAIDLDVLFPSVAFGLSCALQKINNLLPVTGNYQVAPLCSGDPDEVVEKLSRLNGEKIAKIKVGMFEPIRDGMVVNMLLEAIPSLKLRLDANQKWTLDKAVKFAYYIAPNLRERIEFIEEPCQSMAQSLAFYQQTGIGIAWDESSRLENFTLTAQEGLTAVVVKPSLIGSIERVTCLVKQANDLGLKAVISSSLESSIGLNDLARIAKMLTPNTLPGLDTIDLFAAQLETPWPCSSLPLKTLSQCEILWQSQ